MLPRLLWLGLGALASLLILAPLVFLALGYYGTTRYPQHRFKTVETAAEWSTLHPTLRLTLWLMALEDGQLVLTDIAREAHDYEEMGLKRPSKSPHYIKDDGYAHAVDLRVSNVGEVRNWARRITYRCLCLVNSMGAGCAEELNWFRF